MSVGPTARDGRIRVALLGFGRVGAAVLELALTRPWIDVVAVIARREERHGSPAASLVPSAPAELRIRTDLKAALRESRPDVVIMATTSRLASVLVQLEVLAAEGCRVIVSTSEELAHVEPADGPEAAALHRLVERSGMTLVATGVNPGFVLDLWPLLLSGLAWDVERLDARRVVDVSVFAPHTRRQLGIGHAGDGFGAGVRDGTILGHLGFRESLRILCAAMGTPPERISVETLPILATRDHVIADGTISAGTTVGVSQRAVAWRDERPWIDIELLLHAAPAEEGIRTVDEIHLHGRHELHATLDPGAAAILSTAALLVNTIPAALRAEPGLHGPGRLPPSAPWLAHGVPSGPSPRPTPVA